MAERLIGVDVGGTKVSVALLEDGRLSEPVLHPTDQRGSSELVAQLIDCVKQAGTADAVGVGVPSVIDFETGTARSSVNIPLQGVPLRQVLSDEVGFPAFVDNDATVAALAEAFDDDLRPIAQTLVMLTIGTGIGGGIVIGGRIFRGATGAAPEIGHIIIGADLESGAPPPAPKLGIGVANVINTFDPELVIVGGGVSTAGELLLEPMRRIAKEYVVPGVGTRTEIRLARYGPQAGVRGAALLAKHELEA